MFALEMKFAHHLAWERNRLPGTNYWHDECWAWFDTFEIDDDDECFRTFWPKNLVDMTAGEK